MENKIKNIAIIAHVDHGKTTLVDHLLRQSGTFGDHQEVEERIMDSMDLERERGITISAKNASFRYKDYKVNIVDTPGHSDFGGEVERSLNMVDGTVLLVDASEGPLPQTRFVLERALAQNLKILVCINKIDRSDARISEVVDEVFSLFIDLGASEEQAEFDVVYAVAKDGVATWDPEKPGTDLRPLLDYIVDKFPDPHYDEEGPLQFLVSNIGYNEYVGQLAIGRVRSGFLSVGNEVALYQKEEKTSSVKIVNLFCYEGLQQVPTDRVSAGDIAVVALKQMVEIGDCLTAKDNPRPLERIQVEEPTVGMFFAVNDGPFAGREGKLVTSRKILERLEKECKYNVAIRLEMTDSPDTWKVLARGELQLAVLIEQMRREGFELLVSQPQVVFREEDGQKMEPMEKVHIDVEEPYTGVIAEKLGQRKGVLTNMAQMASGRSRMEFAIPARGLIGYRSEFLTDTRGSGLLNTEFAGYEPYKGPIRHRQTGSLVADRKGIITAYALASLEARGRLFVSPGVECYVGMVIGENAKENELIVNPCKEKKLTNVRASGSDEAVRLTPVKPMTLEKAMEWIGDGELIEVTPENLRIRCRELDPHKRKKR